MPRNLIPPQFRKALNQSSFSRRLRSLTWANILLLSFTIALILSGSVVYFKNKRPLISTLPHIEELQRALVQLEGALDQMLISHRPEILDNAIWHYEGLARSLHNYQLHENRFEGKHLQHLSLALNKLERDAFQLLQGEKARLALADTAGKENTLSDREIRELKRFVGECIRDANEVTEAFQREQERQWWLVSIPIFLAICYGGWYWGKRQMRFLGQAFHETVDLVNFQVAQQKVLFASISDAVLVLNREQEASYFNPEAERLLGVKLSQGRGKALSSFLGVSDRLAAESLLSTIQRVTDSPKAVVLPKTSLLLNRKGGRYHVEGTVSPIFDEKGMLNGVILVFRDCSETRQKELSLMAREQLYRSVFNQQYQYLIVLDAMGRVMEMNEPFVKLNEGDAKTHFDTKFWDLPCWKADPYFENLWQDRLRQAASEAEPLYCEDVYWIDGKEKRYFEGYIAMLVDEEGLDKGYLIQAQDVTDRKQVDEKIQNSANRTKFLGHISDSIRFLSDPMEVVRTITGHLTEFLEVSHCAYLEVDPTQQRADVLYDFFMGEKRPLAGSYALSDFGEVSAQRLTQGEPIICQDVKEQQVLGKLGEELRELQLRATVTSPLCKDGRLLAMLLICDSKRQNWTPETVRLIDEVVERLYSYVERIRSEEATKHIDERYRLAVKATNDVVWDWNLETDEVAWNDAVSVLCGYDPGEIEPKMGWWFQLILPEDLPRITKTVKQRIEDGSDFWGSEYRIRRKDGTIADVYDRGYLIKNDQGKSTRMIGAIQDLRERTEAKRQLEDSALKLQLSLDAALMGTWDYDPETEQVVLDLRSQQLLGLEDSQQVPFEVFKSRFRDEDFESVFVKRPKVHSNSIHSIQGEVRHIHRERNEDAWLEIHGSSHFNPQGVLTKTLGTLKDISDQKNFELSLQKAKTEVEVASKAKDNFLAALSHELRTPLTPVLMTISSMKEELAGSSDLADQLEMVQRNIELEARLIDDLLDLTKITEAKLILRLQPCDLHALLLHATDIVKEELYAKKQRLAINLKAELTGVEADSTRIQQVFWNLLRNAIKFSDSNTEIVITTYNDADGNWHAEFADHGVGVSPEALQSIFEPFEQAGKQNDHRFGGLGLGLAIARGVVQMHGGVIQASSKGLGQGAVFRVTLPKVYLRLVAEPESEPRLGERHETQLLKEKGTRRGPNRILVVDDHEPTLNVIEKLLRRRGYEVRTAASVEGALRIAQAMDFDLVLSDIGLPDGNGAQLMKKLRDQYGLTGIALSGYGMDKDIARGIESGFVQYLTKPISATQLLHAVDELARTKASVVVG